MTQRKRRYHAPDRKPVVGKPFVLEWDGCEICYELHEAGTGQYHTLDGKRPIAFTSDGWHFVRDFERA